MKLEIYKSLADIDVITILIAAMRLRHYLSSSKIREIDVESMPYLSTGKVLGLAIVNQIV